MIETVIGSGIVATVVASVIGYILGRSKKGCSGGHVWGEWRDSSQYRIAPGPQETWKIENRRRRTCQCEDCWETERKWRSKKHINHDDWEELIN